MIDHNLWDHVQRQFLSQNTHKKEGGDVDDTTHKAGNKIMLHNAQ